MATETKTAAEINIFDPAVMSCPHATYRRLIDEQPVHRAPLTGSPIISRYEDVVFALRHPEIFSSEMSEQMALGTVRPMIPQQIDPPDQTRYRKILDPQFSRKRMAKLEPAIRADAKALIDGFEDQGECEFNKQFAIPLPCNAFLHLMGLPLEDLDLFLELKDGIIRPKSETGDFDEMAKIRTESGRRIYAYFENVIEERSRAPRDDMMGYLLGAEIDGKKLSHNEILDICYLFLLGGLDTVTATLGCSIAYLAANPDQRHKIVDELKFSESALEELLRWETPVTGVPRVVKKDCEIAGTEIKQGEVVMLLLGAANLDPGEFEDADVMNLERERNRQIAFGSGPHRCLGSHLARMELRAGLEEWHKRIPDYEIKAGETPIYSIGIREVQYLPLVWS
ncbi:MAG: cytochrome P450 [Deltaproteobacteria bacterium]|nr:cytochrome P450 [Deltaproteobacteria bacterium]MBW2388825.1 cytochrome P450 [Deltaproteobacteria bacterium]MBW2725759.1 cytochrome P450 [Deltaproteobacteria bacterium]